MPLKQHATENAARKRTANQQRDCDTLADSTAQSPRLDRSGGANESMINGNCGAAKDDGIETMSKMKSGESITSGKEERDEQPEPVEMQDKQTKAQQGSFEDKMNLHQMALANTLQAFRTDFADFKASGERLRTDLKASGEKLRTDFAEFKASGERLRTDFADFKASGERLRTDFADFKAQIGERVDNLKIDMVNRDAQLRIDMAKREWKLLGIYLGMLTLLVGVGGVIIRLSL